MGPFPPPPPQRPPRRKPGETDPNEKPRKGRCLVRDEKKAPDPKPVFTPERETPPARNPKAQDYQLLNGIRVNKGFFWLCSLVVFLFILGGLSVPAYYLIKTQSDQPEEEVDDAAAALALDQQTDKPEFDAAPLRDSFQELKSAALKRIDEPAAMLEEVMTYNAMATGFDRARTYSMEGSVKTATREYDMNLFVKAPNQVRQVLSMENMKVTSIFDGIEGKLQAQDYIKNREMEREMTNAQSVSLLMSAMPSMPLWQYNVNPEAIEYGGQRSIDGVMCYVIKNTAFQPYTIEHFIDMETFLERLRVMEGLDENDQPFSVEVKLLDYKKDGEFMTPTLIDVQEKSAIEVTSSFKIEKSRFNQGLLPSLFSLDNS